MHETAGSLLLTEVDCGEVCKGTVRPFMYCLAWSVRVNFEGHL